MTIDADDIIPIERALLANLDAALKKNKRIKEVEDAREALRRFYSHLGMY